MQYKLTDLIKGLDVTIKGDTDCLINGVCHIQQSKPGYITFLANGQYRKYLQTTEASAVILAEEDAAACPATAIISANPYYTYAKIAAFFAYPPQVATVVMGEGCEIHPTASIGAYTVLGKNVRIAANALIGAGCCIDDDTEIGEATILDAHVTIYHRTKIGKRTHLMSGAIIGGDGFGFANQKGVWHKVSQLGSVSIGDDVDIGANTTIDRGAIGDTVIGSGVKLDNLIQIGHNVKIGENTVIAGCTGIAGSTEIGKNCMIGGAVMIAGHLTIADNVILTGGTGVGKSIREPGMYSSGILGLMTNQEFRKNSARFHRLENLMDRVKTLELALKEMTERK